jgi:hypothetical protein
MRRSRRTALGIEEAPCVLVRRQAGEAALEDLDIEPVHREDVVERGLMEGRSSCACGEVLRGERAALSRRWFPPIVVRLDDEVAGERDSHPHIVKFIALRLDRILSLDDFEHAARGTAAPVSPTFRAA